jgi:hypothetical protein
MRPIPDDVEPAPHFVRSEVLVDGGVLLAASDGGSHVVALAHEEHPVACQDARHKPLRVRQIASDRWSVARGVIDAVRSDKAHLSPQLDANGHTTGLVIDDVSDGCFAALGFQTGDVIHTINGQELDWSSYSLIYRSIMKDGNAVVRFDRHARALTAVYEVTAE